MKIKDLDLEIIDENEVPPRKNIGKWRDIFKQIPKGKALVLEGVSRGAPANCLRQMQKKGDFPNYYVTQRNNRVYVVNSNKLE